MILDLSALVIPRRLLFLYCRINTVVVFIKRLRPSVQDWPGDLNSPNIYCDL